MNTFSRTLGLLVLLTPILANAASLFEIYELALNNDPTLDKAKATQQIAHEGMKQARSVLLPQVGISQSRTLTHTALRSTPAAATDFSSSGSTRTSTLNGTLSQTLFNYNTWNTFKAAKHTVAAADVTYWAAEQEIIHRVIELYFNVLRAEDVLRFNRIKEKAILKALEQAKQRHAVGLDTKTSVYEARAAYASAQTSTMAQENILNDAKEQLRETTGSEFAGLNKLRKDMPLARPDPDDINEWVNRAKQGNLSVIAAQYSVAEAFNKVKAAKGKHLPTLSADVTWSRADSAVENTDDTITETTSSMVTLSMPLFQGGLVSSQVKAAEQSHVTAIANLESSLRNAIIKTRQDYLGVITNISKIKADKKIIRSQISALKGAKAELEVGTKTTLDVLDAQQKLFEAQSKYTNDLYDYIVDHASLLQDIGQLTDAELKKINEWVR